MFTFFPLQGPGHAMAIPALPPVAEESVTVVNKDEHKSIADVFPEVQVKNLCDNNYQLYLL